MKKSSFYVRTFDEYGYMAKEAGFTKPWHAIFTWIKWFKETENVAIFATDEEKAFELISYAYYNRNNVRWHIKKFALSFDAERFIGSISKEFGKHDANWNISRAIYPFDLSEKGGR